jgi:hypothetical protein
LAHLVLGFGSSHVRLLSPPPTHLVLGFGSSCARLLSLGQTMSASSSATHCLMKAIIHTFSSLPFSSLLFSSLLFSSLLFSSLMIRPN